MGRLGVPDRYVDAFCGRVLQSVLARHYTDFSPERLKEIYDHAGLRIFDGDEISYTRDKSDDYRSHTLMLIRQKEESGQPQS
jgi:hypothetical protein